MRLGTEDPTNDLIAESFPAGDDYGQMDMFIDNPVVVLTNDLRFALGNGSLRDATRLIRELHERSPDHPELGDFERLLGGLVRTGTPVTDAGEELRQMQQIDPLARRLLGRQFLDYLTPLWRRLANALSGVVYDGDAPELHSSHALLQIEDFKGVLKAVLKEPRWQAQFSLCLRLTEAACYGGDDTMSISAWCHLCWHNPKQAIEITDVAKHTGPLIGRWWEAFLDTDELPVTDFPAWLLITAPGLIHRLPERLPVGNSAGEELFMLVHRLVRARRDRNEELEMTLRKRLSTGNPPLFQYLKSRV